MLARDLATHTPLPYIEHLVKQNGDSGETRLQLSFGMRKVRLPQRPQHDLRLVAVKDFGEDPLMLLTTEPLSDSRNRQTMESNTCTCLTPNSGGKPGKVLQAANGCKRLVSGDLSQ
jgi:hypothetical protein